MMESATVTAVLGLGSNIDDAHGMLDRALAELEQPGCVIEAQSSRYTTSKPYLNQVVAIATSLPYAELRALSKSIEASMGRTPQMKAAGIVPIDIDIVTYDGQVMRQADFAAPYFVPGYQEITPDNPH